LWDYYKRSAAYILGDSIADKDSQAILDALRGAPERLTRSEIRRGLFGDNKPATYIAARLAVLLKLHLARFEKTQTGGRSSGRWFATNLGRENVKSVGTPVATSEAEDQEWEEWEI
jgi:hypothetical protein